MFTRNSFTDGEAPHQTRAILSSLTLRRLSPLCFSLGLSCTAVIDILPLTFSFTLTLMQSLLSDALKVWSFSCPPPPFLYVIHPLFLCSESQASLYKTPWPYLPDPPPSLSQVLLSNPPWQSVDRCPPLPGRAMGTGAQHSAASEEWDH